MHQTVCKNLVIGFIIICAETFFFFLTYIIDLNIYSKYANDLCPIKMNLMVYEYVYSQLCKPNVLF